MEERGDADGDSLSYTVGQSSYPAAATVALSDGVLTVTPLAVGQASATVSASEDTLGSGNSTLSVTVEPAATAIEVRIAARRTATGRAEFAIQVRQADGDWDERQLSPLRFLSNRAPLDRWLVSTPLNIAPQPEQLPDRPGGAPLAPILGR